MDIVFLGLGALFVAISLVEIIAHQFGGLQTLTRFTGLLLGRSETAQSDMENAMFWVRVLGLLLFGGLAIAVGLSVQGA